MVRPASLGLRGPYRPALRGSFTSESNCHAAVVEPPVLGAMRRSPEVQALLANGLCQLADDVALGAHLGRAPIGEAAVVHGETVVMLGHRHDDTSLPLCGTVPPIALASNFSALNRGMKFL